LSGIRKEELERTEALGLYLAESARDNLLTYTELTFPKYRAGWHHRVIIEHLEAVAEGRVKRLMILVPPRYGKSELASIRFPAWYLGKNPEKKIILASYNDRFALHFGKHARNLCQSEMHGCVFGTRVRRDSSSGSLWELEDGGKFVAVGRGGSVTGHGAHLLLLDDLIKNVQEAYSENVRDTIWDWYKTTLYTRTEDGAGIVVVNTRWHTDDLVGRLLRDEGEKWTVLKLPAVADMDYVFGEHVYRDGETLWPEKFPLEAVNETRAVLGSHFNSIYQQEPEERAGNIFRRGEWRRFTALPAGRKWAVQSWDTGFKTGEENSYSACTTWIETESGYYLVHAWWGRVTFPELKRCAVELYERFRPDEVLVEDKASGQSLMQELAETTKMPVKGVKPVGDKVARAHAVTPVFESGNVYIHDNADWTDEVIACAASFPRTKNTDVVDSITQAIEHMRHGRRFAYSYHGGGYARAKGRKTIFEMEREKGNG